MRPARSGRWLLALRPGVNAFSLGFGQWYYGAGRHAPTLVDPVGGSAVFYDTRVKLVRV